MSKFKREKIRFPDEDSAQEAISAAGFCLGTLARDEPRGMMVDYDYIAKWRNLSAEEKQQLHAIYQRHGRGGPVTITIQKDCPAKALRSLRDAALEAAGSN